MVLAFPRRASQHSSSRMVFLVQRVFLLRYAASSFLLGVVAQALVVVLWPKQASRANLLREIVVCRFGGTPAKDKAGACIEALVLSQYLQTYPRGLESHASLLLFHVNSISPHLYCRPDTNTMILVLRSNGACSTLNLCCRELQAFPAIPNSGAQFRSRDLSSIVTRVPHLDTSQAWSEPCHNFLGLSGSR